MMGELEGVIGGETMVGTYCVREKHISNKKVVFWPWLCACVWRSSGDKDVTFRVWHSVSYCWHLEPSSTLIAACAKGSISE